MGYFFKEFRQVNTLIFKNLPKFLKKISHYIYTPLIINDKNLRNGYGHIFFVSNPERCGNVDGIFGHGNGNVSGTKVLLYFGALIFIPNINF